MRLDLPSGGWVVFGDPAKVSEGRRRPWQMAAVAAQRAVNDAAVSIDEQYAVVAHATDLAAVALIDDSSFTGGRMTVEQLLDLEGGDYDLVAAQARDLMMRAVVNTDPDPDPKATGVPSSD